MKVAIVYFSGTGNTRAVAEGYKLALTNGGHFVSIISIEKNNSISDHDLLIIGGPIYAGNVPDELINWVRKHVWNVNDKKAIVFSTSAGLMNANGVKSIAKKLGNKGYDIIDMATYEMPRNFYVDKYDPTPEHIQKQQFEAIGQKILESLSCLNSQEKLAVNESIVMLDFYADLFRVMAKFMGRSFSIDETCIGCGLCERNCPKENIRYIEKEYSNKCIMCTRCIHNCPVNAISYKGKKIEPYRVHHEINLGEKSV
jgi:ferredoxin